MLSLSKSVACLAISTALASAPVHAQGAEFSLGGGATIPLGNFGDVAKTGWNGLVGVSFTPPTLPLGFQVDGMYQRLGVDGGGLDLDATNQIIQGTANAIYKFKTAETSPVRPYLIGGVGVYNFKTVGDDADLFGDGDSSTDFGINLGAGFDFKLSSIGAFVEGRFHDVFTDGENVRFLPITVGIRLGGS
jgi:opacity protein-like surface antigen